MSVSPERIERLLNPTSIAVVGASDSSPWSRGFVRNITQRGDFRGSVHMVNPRRDEAHGQPCHDSIAGIDESVDHALILVGAARVRDVLTDAAAAGVRSATVLGSGFSEAGAVGRQLADDVQQVCLENEIALIGPNCYGFNNYAGTFVSRYSIDVPALPGHIGLAIQSGQLGGAIADAAHARGIRLRYLVSSGNELVTDTNDYLDYYLSHPDIKVLGAVMERIPEPDRFADIARRALEAGKPIVVLKLGRSAVAERIAVAHTGSITGSDAVADTFLRDLGVIRVSSAEELAETAGLLARAGWPSGHRTFFAGFSGGAAGLFADQASDTSLDVIEHSEQTRKALAAASGLDPAVIHNPFDMTVDGGQRFVPIAEAMAAAPESDIVVLQGQPRRAIGNKGLEAVNKAHEKALTESARRHGKLAVFLETGDHQPGLAVFEHEPEDGAYYLLGRNGVASLANAADYGRQRDRILSEPTVAAIVPAAALPNLPAEGAMSEIEGKQLLEAYGIPTSQDAFARDGQEAAAHAQRIGFPVVVKVVAPEITHKSDAGGVILGLDSPQAVEQAFAQVVASAAAYDPSATVEGVIVSKQVSGGREFYAGALIDPSLGPVVVAGLGGIFIEVFKDTAMARPPLSPERALATIDRLASARILDGTRGLPELDKGAFATALCRLGQIALDHRDVITEIDINPLVVLPRGQGVVALDALVVTAPTTDADAPSQQ